MALADVLRARAAFQGRAARIECGELGLLTVEALPVRELELLSRGEDGYRTVFYAACRDLQLAGEQLHREGKVYTPDGILQFVSDAEAEEAAKAVFSLSGWAERSGKEAAAEEPAAGETAAVEKWNGEGPAGTAAVIEKNDIKPETAGQKVRAESVPAVVETVDDGAYSAPDEPKKEARRAETVGFGATDEVLPQAAERVAEADGGDVRAERSAAAESGAAQTKGGRAVVSLRGKPRCVFEGAMPAGAEDSLPSAKENQAAAPEVLRETVWRREAVREDEAALAERVARRLLEGLRRANLVKGD